MTANPYAFLPVASIQRVSAASVIVDALRKAIVRLELGPGEEIDRYALCDRFQVSKSPVSEALGRLQLEGLVDIIPQKSSRVSLLRMSDVADCMMIRRALESEIVSTLARIPMGERLGMLRKNLDLQEAATVAGDQEGFHDLDIAFHEIMSLSLSLPRLKDAVDHARGNLDRARRLVMTPARLGVSFQQHVAIYDAIAARSPAAAAAALRQHVNTVLIEIMDFGKRQADFFADGQNFPFDLFTELARSENGHGDV